MNLPDTKAVTYNEQPKMKINTDLKQSISQEETGISLHFQPFVASYGFNAV